MLGLDVKLEYALEAFTKDSDNTEEHRSLQIHVQRGMGKNYERLELLGDSVLKLATTISLFAQNPDDDEYDYHVNRMCLICNKNLFINANKRTLYEYIRSRGFSRYVFSALFYLSEKLVQLTSSIGIYGTPRECRLKSAEIMLNLLSMRVATLLPRKPLRTFARH